MSPRRLLGSVALVAATVIGLEITTFQALCFVNDYMTATATLAIALLGLAVGGIGAFASRQPDRHVRLALIALPISVLGTFVVVARLNPWPLLLMALCLVPYALASFVIGVAFVRLPPARVYAADLGGAALGALVAVAAIPWLREEGTFILLASLGGVPLLLLGAGAGRFVPVLGGGVLLVLHVTLDPWNLIRIATADPALFAEKVFLPGDDGLGRSFDLLYSRGSLIERIDLIGQSGSSRWQSVYNGRVVDAITSKPARDGQLDNRMPTLLKWGDNPDTLLVGPSGQGLCKAVQGLGDGHIDAVEINGAIAGLMANEMYQRSGRAYEGMALTIGDVRTFLARTDRRYDFITLLNTHRIWSVGHEGPPEYVHTLEAMRAYLDHLQPDGFVLFEERTVNERATLGVRRVLLTLAAALRERGETDPARDVAVWENYHNCAKGAAATDACDETERFTFILAKAAPLSTEEQERLRGWGELLDARDARTGLDGDFRGIKWRHLPDRPSTSPWSMLLRADDPAAMADVSTARVDQSVVTDDRPYPYDVFRARSGLWRMLGQTAALATVFVLAPAALLFGARRPQQPIDRQAAVVWLPWFGLLGVAYLVVEVVLVQRLGIFLQSPVIALAVVLATMLVASGLGGLFSGRLPRRGVLGAHAAVVGLVLAGAGGLSPVLDAAFGGQRLLDAGMALPLPARVAVAVLLVAPLAATMGVPFPWVAARVRARLGDRHTALFFAVNGAFAATASPLALLMSSSFGFTATLQSAAAAYLICGLLLAVVREEPASAR